MILIHDNKIISRSPNSEEINNIIDRLAPNKYEPIILESETTGNYIQLLCSKENGIAESRIYSGESFEHYRAFKDSEESHMVSIQATAFKMNVETKYLLDSVLLKKLMIDFLNTENLSNKIEWCNITDEFK